MHDLLGGFVASPALLLSSGCSYRCCRQSAPQDELAAANAKITELQLMIVAVNAKNAEQQEWAR